MRRFALRWWGDDAYAVVEVDGDRWTCLQWGRVPRSEEEALGRCRLNNKRQNGRRRYRLKKNKKGWWVIDGLKVSDEVQEKLTKLEADIEIEKLLENPSTT